MASAQAGGTPGAKGGKAGMIMTLGALTVLGAIGGGLVGKLVTARHHGVSAAASAPATVAPKVAAYTDDTEVKELPAIVTNLADSGNIRVRLVVAIVYAKKAVEKPAVLAARIGDDIVAYTKTLTLAQLEGSSGLQNLREDLNERAAVRSQGAVREVIIEALVTQ